MSEHAFERPSAARVREQLQAITAEFHASRAQSPSHKARNNAAAAPQSALAPTPPHEHAASCQQHEQPRAAAVAAKALTASSSTISGHSLHSRSVLMDVLQQRSVSPTLQVSAADVPRTRLPSSRSFTLACAPDAPASAAALACHHSCTRALHSVLSSPRLLQGTAAPPLDAPRGGCGSESFIHGEGCRPMPYTTSVRIGLASVMRPLSAQSSSVSGWLSDCSTSMSCASIPTLSMA
jgi:hypothetical protein